MTGSNQAFTSASDPRCLAGSIIVPSNKSLSDRDRPNPKPLPPEAYFPRATAYPTHQCGAEFLESLFLPFHRHRRELHLKVIQNLPEGRRRCDKSRCSLCMCRRDGLAWQTISMKDRPASYWVLRVLVAIPVKVGEGAISINVMSLKGPEFRSNGRERRISRQETGG